MSVRRRTGLALLLLLILPLRVDAACSGSSPTLTAASAARNDVNDCVTAAVDGDTISFTGSATWTLGITISGKGIHLQGAGSGRIIARSSTSLTVGTGSKVFTTQAGLSVTGGQTLHIRSFATLENYPSSFADGRATWMEGTVTSYTGTTLTMNITSTAGSGTLVDWLIATTSASVITHNVAGAIFTIVYDASHAVELSDFKIAAGSGSGAGMILIGGALTDVPGRFHDLWIESNAASDVFRMTTCRGLFYNLSVDSSPFENGELAWHTLCEDETSSWETASTMGTADTDGRRNLYIEDSDVHDFLHFSDFGNNARAVIRNNLIHRTAVGTHGQDTDDYGVRHVEVIDNTFVVGGEATPAPGYPINYWLLQRGGTGLWTGNVVPDIRPSDSKPELSFGIYVLRESQSNDPCWGEDIMGAQYPAPRQIGFGYVTGTGLDGIGGSTYNGVYVGDSEPWYYWNNTGIATPVVAVDDTSDGGCVGSLDSDADYFQSGRDYFINAGAKPGWTAFEYPHPDRDAEDPPAPPSDGLSRLRFVAVLDLPLLVLLGVGILNLRRRRA